MMSRVWVTCRAGLRSLADDLQAQLDAFGTAFHERDEVAMAPSTELLALQSEREQLETRLHAHQAQSANEINVLRAELLSVQQVRGQWFHDAATSRSMPLLWGGGRAGEARAVRGRRRPHEHSQLMCRTSWAERGAVLENRLRRAQTLNETTRAMAAVQANLEDQTALLVRDRTHRSAGGSRAVDPWR